MSFVSPSWLLWMWVTVGLYWLAPRQLRPVVLATLSAAFLLTISPESAFILAGFCGLVHLASNVFAPTLRNTVVATLVIVGVLAGFKLTLTVRTDEVLETIILPLGLSYYTFRCIHFLIERFKGRIARTTVQELVAYLFFLPTFVVGPIHRFDAFASDTRRQRFDLGLLSLGFERIAQGYVKIVLFSNYATENLLGNYIAALPDQSGIWVTYLGVAQNGLNLYFQFSGHSDIAIGFAMLLGYRVMENFNWPYLQPNIQAFWQSWHRSLSLWCRDYIYAIVVARSRSPALGALATMTAIGLWHEISFRFLLWGAWHGFGIIVWQRFQTVRETSSLTLPAWLRWPVHVASILLTVHFVWFGFVILTAPSIDDALTVFTRMFGGP